MDSDSSNLIAAAACNAFNDLPKKGKPNPSTEWTTMAAIIQQNSNSNDKSLYKVVAIGTGTKCLGKCELTKKGDVVSDCHAEVVARRSFLLYLYEQIDLLKQGSESKQESILELINSNVELKNNLKLKPDIKFHMFISHLPCGDASIIENEVGKDKLSSNDNKTTENDNELEPSNSKRIKLDDSNSVESETSHRTGAKLQVGPLQYEENQALGKCRVKPGKGDPTLCMSCSDKLAKWQILGLQGALLTIIITDPIRLHSIVIGGDVPFSKTSLERAIFNRFVHSDLVSNLCDASALPIYQQSQQNFMQFADGLVPAPASISWYLSSKVLDSKDIVQVIVGGRKQGATKKSFGKPPSMVNICRAKIFTKFKQQFIQNDSKFEGSYSQAKMLSANYISNWKKLKETAFEGWTTKPVELKQFN